MFPSSEGISPDRLFRIRAIHRSEDRFPNSGGMLPDIPLSMMYSMSSEDRFPSSGGIPPDMSFWRRSSATSEDRFPSSGGIPPETEVLMMDNTSSELRFPSSAGILPDRAEFSKASHVSEPRLPNSAGIAPERPALCLKSSHTSWSRSPNSGGSSPDKPLSSRITSTTRPWYVATPYQSARSSSDPQLVLSVQLSPSVASYKAINAARSLAAPLLAAPACAADRSPASTGTETGFASCSQPPAPATGDDRQQQSVHQPHRVPRSSVPFSVPPCPLWVLRCINSGWSCHALSSQSLTRSLTAIELIWIRFPA